MTAFVSSEHQSLEPDLPDITKSNPIPKAALPQENDPKQDIHIQKLVLANGLVVSFGDIIALSGDYYGIPDCPISLGKTDTEREERFLKAFESFNTSPTKEITTLLEMIAKEKTDIETGLKNNITEESSLLRINTKELVKALVDIGPRYVTLAENNVDHFNETAQLAYQTGHQLAMKAAAAASALTDANLKAKQFNYALCLEAYACHFLTDLFATGHIRTPRLQLNQAWGKEIGSLLALLQHNEECDEGLILTNGNRQTWQGYGDGHLFETKSAVHKEQAKVAVQVAADEVYQAYFAGRVLNNQEIKVYDLIPTPTENNYSPLFVFDTNKKTLTYRTQLSQLQSKNYQKLDTEGVLRILAYYGAKNIDDTVLGGKIAKIQQDLLAEEKKVEGCFSKMTKLCFFKTNTPSTDHHKEVTDKKRSCCVIL